MLMKIYNLANLKHKKYFYYKHLSLYHNFQKLYELYCLNREYMLQHIYVLIIII
jgi:hypothetical protein